MAKLVHNVQKKQHRERSQLSSRAKLGFLEKHKDYVKRAQDYHRKENTLKILRGKAKERNPDEYYHAMTSRQTDPQGLLIQPRGNDESLATDQVKLLKTQDSNYVRTMRQRELRQLEKQKQDLAFHSQGKHTVFVTDKDELDNFDPVKYFNTTPDMLQRRENRLTKDQLAQEELVDSSEVMPKESLDKKKLKKYKLLKDHLDREAKLKEVNQRMDAQREVMKKGSKKKTVDAKGNVAFKWRKQRKR
ncbi:hypothetical protein ZYGM_003612 [Zygosaccharomyces mellis]|uniref:U3 small nucleolar RNA-associated protein 11 n=1 Tax=Zygosaccharomyces mellis TaxID=42258 RepID=A0A4C2E0X8_9SACH|nr:hypothetical protein ZYGM_003612 [Zygosaccharomyces mellis]